MQYKGEAGETLTDAKTSLSVEEAKVDISKFVNRTILDILSHQDASIVQIHEWAARVL